MKKILILLIACICLISCNERKVNYRIYTGRVIEYQSHLIRSNQVIIRLDDGQFFETIADRSYTCEGDEYNNDIYMYHYYHDKSHIRLVFSDKNGFFQLDSVNEIK